MFVWFFLQDHIILACTGTQPPYVEISLSTITNTSRDVFCCCWQSLVVNWKSSTPVVCITFCSTFFTRAIGIDVMESLDSRICLDPKIFRFRFVIPLFLWHSLTKVTLSTLDQNSICSKTKQLRPTFALYLFDILNETIFMLFILILILMMISHSDIVIMQQSVRV